MSAIPHVGEQSFDREIVESPVPVLLDLYADWCGPCRMLSPTLERLAAEFAGRVRIVKVNIDREPGLADRFRVSSIPTLVVVMSGREVGRTTGLVGEAGLRQALNRIDRTSALA